MTGPVCGNCVNFCTSDAYSPGTGFCNFTLPPWIKLEYHSEYSIPEVKKTETCDFWKEQK